MLKPATTMQEVEYVATALGNVLGGTLIGQALDNWMPPLVNRVDGQIIGRGNARELVEVLAQFSVSMLAAKGLMNFLIPSGSWYSMPISDGLFYATLFYAQPNLRRKGERLVRNAVAAILPLPHLQAPAAIAAVPVTKRAS